MQPSKRWGTEGPRWLRKVVNQTGLRDERGSAAVEFITAGVILLVPLVYLILAVSSVQAGALAVEGAARQAARVYVQAGNEAEAEVWANRAVQFALADHGVDAATAVVEVSCDGAQRGCLEREAVVTVSIRIAVPLPLVPSILDLRSAASMPLQASATQTVSRFWVAAP